MFHKIISCRPTVRMERVKGIDNIRNEAGYHWLRRYCLESVLEGIVNGRKVRGRRR